MLPPSGMIGAHPSIRKIQDIIRRLAVTDGPVLITGESGTGKELVARAIHNLSLRANRPFVPAIVPRSRKIFSKASFSATPAARMPGLKRTTLVAKLPAQGCF